MSPVITIDGPAASGKGTVAELVARRLGFRCLDSGAIYRLLALVCLRRGLDADRPAAIAALADALAPEFRGGRVWLGGEDVSEAIRAEEAGTMASRVAALPEVRAALLRLQRSFDRPPGLVADGRDMGTVVFPRADLKVFLTASPEVRAERRRLQLLERGVSVNLTDLVRDLSERDRRDRERSASPLVPAADARPLDSGGLSAEATAELVLAWWRDQKTKRGASGGAVSN